MKGDQIKYRKRGGYQLEKQYRVFVGVSTGKRIETDWLILDKNGWLTIKKAYVWDGPSGPTLDTLDSMRPSLIHDALYQLMRLGLLDGSCREYVDNLFYKLCIEDGMFPVRAAAWRTAVRAFAAFSAKEGTEPKIITAPQLVMTF